eukprot:GFUD01005438.1.p1 GENE.GFUD01005438.1~~GFUD01005438.1.p1  ORF type:complete len:255 (+),score=74.90 GFUD01005438.1:177-941(+)
MTDYTLEKEYKVVTSDLVNVFITSNITSFTSEKRFDKSLTVSDLKSKLEMIMGGSALVMKINVFDKEDKVICSLENDNALLGSYPVDDGCRLHVEDNSRVKGEFENTAAVEKFELSKDEYAKKTDTVAAFLKKNKLGKYNEEEMAELAKQKEEREAEEKRTAVEGGMVDGARCEVAVAGQLHRRGAVRFAGNVHFQPGWWVGVEYDEPTGKNDGSVGGKRYFTCQAKYGGFVKPNCVKVGDFPVEDLDFSDGEM